ncbi:hypothetical protein G5714_018327 [Onychostoma macrolepis]|uniref:Uncharacterized protein n=1 Tax=Onychostoma macrolepis TaxID=369639 RepID=A0A7J6BZC5_9TELE|nr:hypothetical protein G5714_018327 [Onychostoma macrolepis]
MVDFEYAVLSLKLPAGRQYKQEEQECFGIVCVNASSMSLVKEICTLAFLTNIISAVQTVSLLMHALLALHSTGQQRPLKQHSLGASFSEQGDTEDQDLSESTPDTPSAPGTSCTGSSLESSNEGEPTAVEETASTASTASSKAKKVLSTRDEKRKRMSETDIELRKLEVLKKMAAKVDAEPTPDALTAFGNQVVLDMRLIQDPA